MASIFAYGSLLDEDLVQALTGRRFSRLPAVLTGFRRIEEPGCYPYIVPAAGHRVVGALLLGIDPLSLRKIDAYEGNGLFYRRIRVVVRCPGSRLPAWTYVGRQNTAAPRVEAP